VEGRLGFREDFSLLAGWRGQLHSHTEEAVSGYPLIAGGGVNQQNAAHYILAGVSAISVGKELIPRESMLLHKPDRIRELTKRFATIVRTTRARLAEAQAQVASFR